MKTAKRTRQELEAMPKPQCPAELEVLSQWYFGKKLHLSTLHVYDSGSAPASSAGAQYEVAESYNDYHGSGWLHSTHCINGYDYSRDFWAFVIGPLCCGGIAGHSYGQANVFGHRDALRLRKFQDHLRRKEPGRLRSPFVRLAREHGAGENTATRDSRVQIAGREDGAATVSSQEVAA